MPEAIATLRPLSAADTGSLRDKLERAVRGGAVPLRSGVEPVWEMVAAYGLPDGQTLVSAPAPSAGGDSLAVLYDATGTLVRHVETVTSPRPDQSVDTTVWNNDDAAVRRTVSVDEQHAAAQEIVDVSPLCLPVYPGVVAAPALLILLLALAIPAALLGPLDIGVLALAAWFGFVTLVDWALLPICLLSP
ncbi:hypothetical protein ACWIGW_43455 [Nocardia brasiliensis]